MSFYPSLQDLEVADMRLAALRQSAGGTTELPPLVAETLQALSAALEELHAAVEELDRQNEELVATRQAVEVERHRYRVLFEEAPESYIVTDPNGKILEANRRAGRLFGLRQEFLVGKPLVVFVAPEDRPALRGHLTRLQAGQWDDAHPQELQLTLQPRGSKPFPAAPTVAPVHDLAGHVIGLRWLVRDNTWGGQVESTLRVSQAKLAKALSLGPDAVAITTLAEGRFLEVNESFLRMSGYRREDVIGRTSHELALWSTPQDRERQVRPLENEEAVFDQELHFHTKSGSILIGLTSSERLEIDGVPCLFSVVHDDTAGKMSEEEREKLVGGLQAALAKIKALSPLLPICAWCKRIRDEEGSWTQVEAYIARHSKMQFTHGICPGCAGNLSRATREAGEL